MMLESLPVHRPPETSESDSTADQSSLDVEEELHLQTTRSNAASIALYRTRSQNGYGVSDQIDEAPDATPSETSKEDPFTVGWDGGDADPLCPRSFSKSRKWLIVIIVSHAGLCMTCASSAYTTTYAQMEAEFHNSRIVSVLGLSLFVLGLSFGPMLLGPLSEFYGRRPIYLVSWTAFVIWLIPQAVARNVAVILVFRFLNGFTGSAFLAVSGGTAGDLFSNKQLQFPMATFSVSPFIGPSLGPLIGGFINYNVSWRWTYYVLLIWSFALWTAIVLFVPETYHPILLRNKARRIRIETGDDRWLAPMERRKKSVLRAIGQSLLRPFQLLFLEPMCLNLCIFSAILLGIFFIFFGAFPLIFGTNYGFNVWQSGMTFLGIMVGMFVAVMTEPLWHHTRGRLIDKLERETGIEGVSEPEFRLPPAIVGSCIVPAGLFMFAWSSYPSVHWMVPIVGSAIFGTGAIMVFTGIFTFLVEAYPSYAASALAANAFARCSFAAAFPLFGNQMYRRLGFQWASSLLAFLTIAMLPFPYIFFRYGKKIRARSRFAKR